MKRVTDAFAHFILKPGRLNNVYFTLVLIAIAFILPITISLYLISIFFEQICSHIKEKLMISNKTSN